MWAASLRTGITTVTSGPAAGVTVGDSEVDSAWGMCIRSLGWPMSHP